MKIVVLSYHDSELENDTTSLSIFREWHLGKYSSKQSGEPVKSVPDG